MQHALSVLGQAQRLPRALARSRAVVLAVYQPYNREEKRKETEVSKMKGERKGRKIGSKPDGRHSQVDEYNQ